LNDPFARRVFEDIYSHIQEEKRRNEKNAFSRKNEGQSSADHTMKTQSARPDSTAVPEFGAEVESHSAFNIRHGAENSVASKLKTWLRRQIDDEQVLRLPGESLLPGARVRLQIQHGLNSEPQVIELTLPPEFVPGKTMRLKGMGKRVGKWRGDLYVRIESA
jgi:molecular chaperone DnaJ